MAFVDYTILPNSELVVIDGVIASNVDTSGISDSINVIHWYGQRNLGTIEYLIDPVTGELPPPSTFEDPDDYLTEVSQAEAIIEAQQNPDIFYSTVSGNIYQGATYEIGQLIYINTPDAPTPDDVTTTVPPTPEDFQTLQWDGTTWVLAAFDITLPLVDAQSDLTKQVNASAAANGAAQSRIYSPAQLFTAPDVSLLATADYSGVTLGQYQTYLDGEVATKTAEISAATTVEDLYTFNPTVETIP